MHTEVRTFIKSVRQMYPMYFVRSNVVEMGSLNVCGSVRHFFWFNKKYIGVDLGKGKGVDVVCHAHEYIPDFDVDVVISTEAGEHDINFESSIAHMYAILKNYGLMVYTCAAPNREPHGVIGKNEYGSPFTLEFYKNRTIEEFRKVLPPELFIASSIYYNRDKQDLYFWGIKRPAYNPASKEIYKTLMETVNKT